MTDDLFGWTEKQKGPREKLSPDRARTERIKLRIERGIHPFGFKLREPAGETCGSCGHCRTKLPKYFKCALGRDTKGSATDLRKWWPACEKWVKP